MKKITVTLTVVFILFMSVETLSAQQWWYVSGREGGSAAANNQINLNRGENYVYIYFRDSRPSVPINTVTINFQAASPVTVHWQCAYVPGAVWGSAEEIGVMDRGPIQTDFANFTQAWFNMTSDAALVKNNITGVCLKVETTGRVMFTINDIQIR